ncbi:MAG: cytochrome c nitrite reductase small subunit [Phycisphaerales bacterium]|nr:cytochrome c nitrite reductase small subunit [Phycisphaerales bacterium]
MKTTAAASLAGLALSVVLGVFIGLSGYTFRYAEGTSYLSNDPKACVNCHVMRDEYDGWQKGSHHAAATCNDCHVPQDLIGKYATKAEHGWRHSKGFTLQDFHEPIRITTESLVVVQDNCVRCHGEFVSAVATSRGTQHGMMIGDLNCVHCHSHVGHGPIR